VTFSIEVDFDITTLTNGVPVTSLLGVLPRYFQYDVTTNGWAVAYELFNLSGGGRLVVSQGPPLPDEFFHAYQGDGGTANPVMINVASNTVPVGLAPGRWYVGVFNHAAGPLSYTVEALEVGTPVIIALTNDEVLSTNFSPVQALNTLFAYAVSNGPVKALFELYGLDGDVDLVGNLGTYPLAPPYDVTSANAGTVGEQIVVRTNAGRVSLNGNWYLRVPNNAGSGVNFTIHVVQDDGSGVLVSRVPLNPVAVLPAPGAGTGPTITWVTVAGETYEVQTSPDLVTWTTVLPPLIATGTTLSWTDPNPLGGTRFYRIVQIPGP